MAFLLFTRDKRGYETTSLVHVVRGRQGRSRQKVLYWFRTPPNVKVGRPALDEEAIRLIEERNPEVEFDWPKILAATPPAAPQSDEGLRRIRRGKADRRSAAPRQAARQPLPAPAAARPPDEEADDSPFDELPETPEAQAIEQIVRPDAEERPEEVPHTALEGVVGPEQLTRLRAQYAELLTRLAERGGDAGRIEALRAQAELLNPDSWVTAEEAKKGQAEFESKVRDLRAALGLRPRRRSRRGGRRRRGSGRQGQGSETASTDAPSNSPDNDAGSKGAPEGTDDTAQAEDDDAE